MISEEAFNKEVAGIIKNAVREDVGDGDHSSLACIPPEALGKAKLLVKDQGIIAGIDFARSQFPSAKFLTAGLVPHCMVRSILEQQ